jgi:hypothetical protein
MRKPIAMLAALALTTASLPALAAGGASSHAAKKHEIQIPSITDLVTQYAVQISTATPTTIAAALTVIASPATFDAASWTTKIQAAVGTPSFVQTVVDAVNAAIAARLAAAGKGYVTVGADFIAAAKAANPATK